MQLSKEGVEFIVKEETGGREYYEKVYKSTFVWPGGRSGATAMVGIDVGYYTISEVDAIFKSITTPEQLKRIHAARKKTGVEGREACKTLKDIKFSWETAIEKFEEFILPKFTKLTMRVFPGVEDLCDGAQAALVSIVFNRGTSLEGSTRKEMLQISKLVPDANYLEIAEQIKSMKRLWEPTSGLIGRREREAALVEACA